MQVRFRFYRKGVPAARATGSRAALFMSICIASTLLAAPRLETVLANMDVAAAEWRGMRAQVQWTRYRSFVDDETVESGRIAVRRAKSGNVEMLVEITEPSNYFLLVRGPKIEQYKPKIKLVEEFDAGNRKDQLDNALMIGFGTSGRYLSEHYAIKLVGAEPIAGHPAIKLDLQPKNPAGRLNNRPLEMWVSTDHWQPVQYKMYERNQKDYRLHSYSEMQVNPSLSDGDFKLRLKRGTRRTRPQR